MSKRNTEINLFKGKTTGKFQWFRRNSINSPTVIWISIPFVFFVIKLIKLMGEILFANFIKFPLKLITSSTGKNIQTCNLTLFFLKIKGDFNRMQSLFVFTYVCEGCLRSAYIFFFKCTRSTLFEILVSVWDVQSDKSRRLSWMYT